MRKPLFRWERWTYRGSGGSAGSDGECMYYNGPDTGTSVMVQAAGSTWRLMAQRHAAIHVGRPLRTDNVPVHG